MRIILLSKLIKDEETEECRLENCNLVVDGSNFFYNSYEESKIPYVFGADAKEYARYVRINKLLKFKRANVKCYFVFKGGDNDIDKKLRKIESPKFDFESNHKFVPPLFTREVCLQMLEEFGINYTTCVTSNTDDCIALAEVLGCAVLSNNIEYCFKKVPYIPMTTLKYSNPNNYITGGQYKLQNFLNKYSLTERKFAIFAALSDVHVFEMNHFDDLLKTWDVCDENLYEQNKKLLKWLSEHSEEEALSGVSKCLIDETENEKFNKQYDNLLHKMYHNQWTIATDYLFNDCRLNVLTPDPWWFEKGVVSQNIAIPYINLYKYKLIQGSTAIEKKDSTDSIMVAMDIIVYAYSLLTNFQKSEITIYQDAENDLKINTEDFNVKKPRFICKETVFENGWDIVRHLNLFEHFLKENKINTEYIYEVPLEARLLLITLAYFSRKKMSLNKDVTREVYCYLIYCSISHKLRIYNLHKSSMHLAQQFEGENLIQITEKYFKIDKNEEEEIFDGEKIKTLVEIQYCLLHMNYLNVLCGKKHFPTRYYRFVNGPFIYKLLRDMENLNFNEFLDTQFQSVPTVVNQVHMLIKLYNKLLDNRKPVENWRNTKP